MFARPPPPLPSLEEEDLMDIDFSKDFIFRAPDKDFDRESHHSPIPIPSSTAEAVEEVHSSSKEVVFTDSDLSEDGSVGGDKVMSGPEANSSTEDEDEEMSPSEEEEEEDPMEDLS